MFKLTKQQAKPQDIKSKLKNNRGKETEAKAKYSFFFSN
jgi:hypothetical protein